MSSPIHHALVLAEVRSRVPIRVHLPVGRNGRAAEHRVGREGRRVDGRPPAVPPPGVSVGATPPAVAVACGVAGVYGRAAREWLELVYYDPNFLQNQPIARRAVEFLHAASPHIAASACARNESRRVACALARAGVVMTPHGRRVKLRRLRDGEAEKLKLIAARRASATGPNLETGSARGVDHAPACRSALKADE